MGKRRTDSLGRPIVYVYRHPSHIAGLSHRNRFGRNRGKIARKLKVGSQLILKADPDNPADQDAILVYPADDLVNDIGYLYSFTARYVARKMRGGATFSAEVREIDLSDSEYPKYRVYVYQHTHIKSREPQRMVSEYYRPPQHYEGIPAHHAPRTVEQEPSKFERRSWWQRLFG